MGTSAFLCVLRHRRKKQNPGAGLGQPRSQMKKRVRVASWSAFLCLFAFITCVLKRENLPTCFPGADKVMTSMQWCCRFCCRKKNERKDCLTQNICTCQSRPQTERLNFVTFLTRTVEKRRYASDVDVMTSERPVLSRPLLETCSSYVVHPNRGHVVQMVRAFPRQHRDAGKLISTQKVKCSGTRNILCSCQDCTFALHNLPDVRK